MRRNHSRPSTQWGLLLLALVGAPDASACPYSIRESGFVAPADPIPMRLTLRLGLQAPDRSALEKAFRDAASRNFAGLDVATDVQSAAGNAVSLSLEANDRPSLDLPGVQPTAASIEAAVQSVADSPLRKEIRAHLVDDWCVLLFVAPKQTTGGVGVGVDKEIRAAAERIVGEETELGKKIARGPYWIAVAGDDPSEAVALWSLGLRSETAAPRLALLIGRGERRGPVLEGKNLTPEKVLEAVRMLGRSCSCTTDAGWARGPRLPMRMNEGFDAAVKQELGFDPDDPEAIEEIRRAWERTGKIAPGDPGLAYREIELEEPAMDDKATANPAGELKVDSSRPAHGPLLTILVAAAIVGATATALQWFRRRS